MNSIRLLGIKKRERYLIMLCLAFIIGARVYMGEVYLVNTPSMMPTLQPTELYVVEKLSCGALMPQRFADIPILNIFTWNDKLRKLDEKQNWGKGRMFGFRKLKVNDVILFYTDEKRKTVLVKRIAKIYNSGQKRQYYVLGDNRENSVDSRSFGLICEEQVIGRAAFILFSWDANANLLNRVRWSRIGSCLF